MTLRELAHSAQQPFQTAIGLPVKRSHVHELLAAAFGYSSWAAFRSESLPADAVVAFAVARQVSCIHWVDVRDTLAVAPVLVNENRLDVNLPLILPVIRPAA